MNKIILKEIKTNLKEVMKEKHFISKGQSYFRIINKQIFQGINFQGSSGGDKFTVNITITPLCSNELPCEPNPLIRIGQIFCNGDKWWEYGEDSVNDVIDIIKNKVLPLFEKLSDYRKIYEELKNEINDIPREKKNWTDMKTVLYYSIGEGSCFWLCFRENDYSRCKVLLKKLKEENLKILNINLEYWEKVIKDTQSKKYKEKFEENKKRDIESAKKISNKIELLEKLLENNEIEKLKMITNEYETKNLIILEKYTF